MESTAHPVVAKYLTSGDAFRAILGSSEKTEPIVGAMLLLLDFVNGKQSANGAFLAAKAVDIKGIDTDLCILFLTTWARACYLQSTVIEEQRAAAWTLVHRARALTSNNTPPEISATIDVVESDLVGSNGDRVKQEAILRKTLNTIPAASPRRTPILISLAGFLACAGRLSDMEDQFNTIALRATDRQACLQISLLNFINSVETGQIQEAQSLIPDLAEAETNLHSTQQFKRYRTLLELMRDNPPLDQPHQSPEVIESNLPDWALVLQCLLSGSVHQALRWARTCERRQSNTTTDTDCTSFNLIRAELAEGNGEAARRLMELRNSAGNRHFMDDLFLARINWLANDHETATQKFSTLLKSVDQYRAPGRLDFELRLAVEMPRDALHNLTRTAHTLRIAPSKKVIPTTPQPADGSQFDLPAMNRIIGSSSPVSALRDTILRFSELNVPVLITGETGTGKELVARAIHESGNRHTEPFLAINCGALSDSLLESELFGHEKGAFSGASTAHQGLFEEAGDGTLFLDEIGEISQRLQVVLLRVLETQEVRPVGSSRSRKINCRILASTNAQLQTLTETDRFRSDLLFRLRRLEIHLPPLREREGDILELASFFLNDGRPQDAQAMMSQQLMNALRTYPWPGNVRELRNTIERMRLMNSDKLHYDLSDIDITLAPTTPSPSPRTATVPDSDSHAAADMAFSIPEPDATPSSLPALQSGRSKVRRLMILRQLFEKHRLLTRAEIIDMLQVSPNTATQDLRSLCEEGFILRVQPSASPRSTYFERAL